MYSSSWTDTISSPIEYSIPFEDATKRRVRRTDMRIMDVLKGISGSKMTLEKVPLEDLNRDRIVLQQEQRKLDRRIDKAEKEKQTAFQTGLKVDSVHRQRALAMKMKDLDMLVKNTQRQYEITSHRLRIVDGLIMTKEMINPESSAEYSVINQISLPELTHFVEKATADGALQQDRLRDLVDGMQDGFESMDGGGYRDEDVENIMAVMQRARDSAQFGDAVTIEEGLKEVDSVLHKNEEESI